MIFSLIAGFLSIVLVVCLLGAVTLAVFSYYRLRREQRATAMKMEPTLYADSHAMDPAVEQAFLALNRLKDQRAVEENTARELIAKLTSATARTTLRPAEPDALAETGLPQDPLEADSALRHESPSLA